MQILCDTNILVRMARPNDRNHQSTVDATLLLHQQGNDLVIVPQCLYEFYVVATRPELNNGLGHDPEEACNAIDAYCSLFKLLRDERSVYGQWFRLMKAVGIRGKTAHDARIAAAIIRHRVDRLLTLNKKDFTRYSEFDSMTPQEVLGLQ